MQGFSLMELLVALLLASLLAVLVSSHLATSQSLRLQLQQELLAAALAENLSLQMSFNPSLSLPAASICDFSIAAANFVNGDLLQRACIQLDQLSIEQGHGYLRVVWRSHHGKKSLIRTLASKANSD